MGIIAVSRICPFSGLEFGVRSNLAAGQRAMVPVLLAFLAFITLVACADRSVRGSFTVSQNGETYLIVADDNGGECRPILVGGKIWIYPIGQTGTIEPGR